MNYKHGLCKKLGRGEFNRMILEKNRRISGIGPRKFTGLSLKVLTPAEYMKQYRQLKKVMEQ